ncbi:MAG TPA: PAS domain S-box protein [Candidatus Eisenbacteria bacterium]|nr:PAS domain S-box protein [Candidatus Eisenbacteria bacterium]
MADQGDHRHGWLEAIAWPVAALGANLALETAFPSIESPVFPFLALVFVALRYPNRFAWIGYGVTLGANIVESSIPGLRNGALPDLIADFLTLAAAGFILIRARIRLHEQETFAKDQIRREASRFHQLLASSPDGIWSVDPNGITKEVNGQMAAMLGYRPEEMVGRHFLEFFDVEGQRLATDAFQRAVKGESIAFELPVLRKDGTEARTLCSTHPIVDASGRFVEGFGILRDITERHRVDQERQHALSLVEATLESTADGLLVVDRAGRIARFNERFAHLWRIPTDILASGDDDRAIGFVLSQLEDPDAFVSKVRKLYATPDAESFDTLRFKDGRVFERYSQPQRSNGEIIGRVFSFRDVTDRVRAIEEQKLAMEREATIATNLDAALFTFVLGEEGTILRYEYTSRGAEALYGVSRETVESDPTFWSARVHSEDMANVVRPAMLRLLELQPAVIEVRYQSSRGIHRWHRSQLFPRREADGSIHVDGIEADVTERVKLEDQLRHAQKMEAIGQLAGGVAHDFNNILTAVIGYSDLLLARLTPSDPNRRAVEEIRKGGDRAAGLTRQLLAFGRRSATQPRLVDVNAAVGELEPMLRRLVGEDVSFTLDLAPALGNIRIDPTHFEQIIVNLVVNARDALPRGGSIRIETANARRSDVVPGAPSGDRYVRLRFADTGVGIAPDVLEHIFEPFFTTKEAGRGTGLGLATVYGIVRQHHGTIDVRSEVGRGTTFEIYLPEVTGEEERLAVRADLPERGRERILLVEDDPALLALSREILKELGYDVRTARSGGEALAVLEEQRGEIDLLVTDVVMPEMDGRELARRARERFPSLRLLFVSGYSGALPPPVDERAPDLSFLAKPYTPITLARRVRELIDTIPASPAGAERPAAR